VWGSKIRQVRVEFSSVYLKSGNRAISPSSIAQWAICNGTAMADRQIADCHIHWRSPNCPIEDGQIASFPDSR